MGEAVTLILCKVPSTGDVPHNSSVACCSEWFGRILRGLSTQSPGQKPLCPGKGKTPGKCEVSSRRG